MPFIKAHKPSRSQSIREKADRNGFRHFIFTEGQISRGEWKDDLKSGINCVLYRGRGLLLYEGRWEEGRRNGYGVLSAKRADNSYRLIYEGDWDTFYQGDGRRHYRDGGYYDGEWLGHRREGHGRMWHPDGAYYQGQWAADRPHGLGLFINANGNRYEGEWRDGLKNGRGTYYHLDNGLVQTGVWRDDLCVCSTLADIGYRQSALQPTKYPLQKIELKDFETVYAEEELKQLSFLNEKYNDILKRENE